MTQLNWSRRMNQITFRISRFVLLLLALSVNALPAIADTIVFNGTTTGGPIFNRPNEGQPPTSLSSTATAVPFRRQTFTVSELGTYSLTLASPSFATNDYDPFLLVYLNNGVPNPIGNTPLENALGANDNGGGSPSSLINITLSPGVSYLVVLTGVANDDFGAFTLTFTGPGTITNTSPPSVAPVPEPATMMLVGTGLAGIAAKLRRRRKSQG